MEQKENNKNYESQQKVSLLGFLTELPNFIAVTISAIFSGSLIVWMDFVDSFCNVTNTGFVALLSRKLKKDLKYEYNYGIGKIEAISSLCCDGLLVCGLLFMLISSVKDIVFPRQPSGVLIYVVLLKVINVAFDSYFVIAQNKIRKSSNSAIAITEFRAMLKNLAFDSVALISILVCWAFRKYRIVWYFSPVICIIIVVFFFISTFRHLKECIRILTDHTIAENEQLKIMKVLTHFCDKYEQFDSVSTRQSGNTIFIDLRISFRDETTYAEIKKLCYDISKEIEEQIANSKVSIIINNDK